MNETIVGVSAIKPVFEWKSMRWLNLSLLGEVNGRFVDIRGEQGQSSPSIETLYSDATAPGLGSQPGFAQLGEGLRIKPAIGNLKFNYVGKFQQFFARSSSHNSFSRWTVDFDHTYSLYGNSQPGAERQERTGPDSCAPAGEKCPEIPHSRNLNGSIGVRLLLSESINSATSAVPFYFQQTLGGQDINSALALGSYQDYRFRAPNLLLLQEYFEHSNLGSVWAEIHGRSRKGCAYTQRSGIQSSQAQFCRWANASGGRFPHGISRVRVGRNGRSSQHR
jgi:hypothetical protein